MIYLFTLRIKKLLTNKIINQQENNYNEIKTKITNSFNFIDSTPQIGNILNRKKLSLNGKWNYIVDQQEVGYYNSHMGLSNRCFYLNKKIINPHDLLEYDFDKAPTMEIPSDWNTQDEKLFFYEGTIWFKKSFNYKKNKAKKIFVYFGAINYESIVFLNGKYLGRHEGGFTPFNYEITDKVHNGENFIIVKVNNQRKLDNVPTIIFDWWNYGGITRDVYIVETDNVYIENYKFFLNKNEINNSDKNIYYIIKLNSNLSKKITISIPELNIKESITTDSGGEAKGILRLKNNNLELWSPNNPKLYKIELKLGKEIMEDEIGFRTIETSGRQILLNGEPIFLYGICIHEEKTNGGGRANSPEDAQKLLGLAKELGCNFVRLAHYPHNEYMIKEAEKMGIMVWSEVPVYWTINFESNNTLLNAKHQVKNMINRDQNRANVIIWSIANETPISDKRDIFLAELSKYTRFLDDTRLISMAMQSKFLNKNENILEDNMNQYVDIISLNQYMGWYRYKIDLSKFSFIIPYKKPVLITEFGGGAKYGFHGENNQRWTEEFQENIYVQNLEMINKIEGLVGTTPWILKDFRSPRRVLNGIQDYYNMKGIVSDKGEKKKAFFVMKKWYENKRKIWNKK